MQVSDLDDFSLNTEANPGLERAGTFTRTATVKKSEGNDEVENMFFQL